jgi:hypothetical protein
MKIELELQDWLSDQVVRLANEKFGGNINAAINYLIAIRFLGA